MASPKKLWFLTIKKVVTETQHLLLWRNSDVKKKVFRGLFSAVKIMTKHLCKYAFLQSCSFANVNVIKLGETWVRPASISQRVVQISSKSKGRNVCKACKLSLMWLCKWKQSYCPAVYSFKLVFIWINIVQNSLNWCSFIITAHKR